MLGLGHSTTEEKRHLPGLPQEKSTQNVLREAITTSQLLKGGS